MELIGYKKNDRNGYPSSPVLLNLFPLSVTNEDAISREKQANLVVPEGNVARDSALLTETTRDESGPVDGDLKRQGTWTLNDIHRNEGKTLIGQGKKDLGLDPIGDGVDPHYIEDDIANDEYDASLIDKKRFDREDTSTVILRPTTMRGIPLVDLLQSQVPRGFYVTRSELDQTPDKGKNDARLSTTVPTTVLSVKDHENVDSVINDDNGVQSNGSLVEVTADESPVTIDSTSIPSERTSLKSTTQQLRSRGASKYSSFYDSSTEGIDNPTIINDKSRSVTRNRVRSTTSATETREEESSTRALNSTESVMSSTVPVSSALPASYSTSSTESVFSIDPDDSVDYSTNEFVATDRSKIADTSVSSTSGAHSINATNLDESTSISSSTAIDDDSTSSFTSLEISTTGNLSSSEVQFTPDTSYDASLSQIGTDSLEMTTEASLIQNETENVPDSDSETTTIETKEATTDLEEDHTLKNIDTTQNDQDRKDFTNDDQALATTTTTSFPATTISKLTEAPITQPERAESKFTRGQNRRGPIGSDRVYQFGHRSSGRGSIRQRVRPSIDDRESSTRNVEKTQYPRQRVVNYRGRTRRPVANVASVNDPVVRDDLGDRVKARVTIKPTGREAEEVEASTLSSNETETNDSKGDPNDREEASKEEERHRIGGNVDRFETEVNTLKNTSTRTSGNLPSTRLRKPSAFALTPLQNKSPHSFAAHRKNRPAGGNFSLPNEKLDAANETTEAPKGEKDIDQSSRAQEIAVTLADPPPPSPSTATGRPAFRNALRRKISTTVAPRTDATTSRSTLGFAPVLRDRQKPRAKDKPLQNVTTRPRRPPVLDYDYYEDEQESIVDKSSFNGKLFLTSKGTIRCLDQGNFPHPYSCKKFITCARMVNGLVVGAEYTCPDKLSFDPVGGICNWSAGLGCKE